jgi:hypothetical protein
VTSEAGTSQPGMSPERWEKVRAILDEALERPPNERADYLEGACVNDRDLRSQVESLIASADSSVGALPSNIIGYDSLRLRLGSLSPGARLGPYEIVSLVGAGGMGEVYRARDPRLGREVAIKVLPATFTSDLDRLRRFEQEARAAAALNHPNILTVHEVGIQDGQSYVVSEFLEGRTLRQVLQDSALPVRKVIDYAIHIANGMAAAHEKGIVHRDLKPENLFVTKDDRLKILDFGLVKLMQPAVAGIGATMVATQATETSPGVVLGTVGYMSPEQVKGLAVDHRSDIFSFGLIVYELLSGNRAFTGGTSAEVMTAILRQDVPELPEVIPVGLRHIVAHCVEKDPAQRFQSARDLAFALSQSGVSSRVARVIEAPSHSWWPQRALTGTAALALVVLSVTATRVLWRAPDPPVWSGVMLGGPEIAIGPRLSPDGHLLAFQAMERGLTQVAVMKPESGNWSILTHHRDRGGVGQVNWSPDGTQIYYDRLTEAIYSVPVLGGDEHLVLKDAGNPVALADGTLLVVRGAGQYSRFWPETGRLQELPLLARVNLQTNWSTGGGPTDIALLLGRPIDSPGQALGLFSMDLTSNALRRFTPPTIPGETIRAYSLTRDGKSVVMALSSGATVRVVSVPARGPFDARTLFTVTNDVWGVDGALDGSVYVNLADRPLTLVRLALNGAAEQLARFPLVPDYASFLMLPDGRAVVPARASGQTRLMVVEHGKDPVPLINTAEETAAPMTPVGSQEIAFVIGPTPRQTIAVANVESGRVTRRIAPGKGVIGSIACSPDGRTLFFSTGQIWAVPVSGGEARQLGLGFGLVWDPSRNSLLVRRIENSRTRLFQLPVDGDREQKIVIDEATSLSGTPYPPNAIDARGRLLISLQLRDSWFNPLGILDTLTGHIERVPVDTVSDYLSAAWTTDGHIVSTEVGLHATMWRFRPESR